MSTFQKIAKRLHIDLGDFNVFIDEVLNPHNKDQRKRLFDAYDLSLRRIEVAHAHLEGFVMANVDRLDFEARLEKRSEKMRALEQASIERLERIFEAYRRDRARTR
jgi:hypothetical protein